MAAAAIHSRKAWRRRMLALKVQNESTTPIPPRPNLALEGVVAGEGALDGGKEVVRTHRHHPLATCQYSALARSRHEGRGH
jgi:hypothetical protein